MEYPIVDEETPLLTESSVKAVKRTPLPKFQLLILFTVLLSEPMASSSIFPYINQLIAELDITGGDPRKVGYYAGLIESLFFATQTITVLQWGRISDRIGRKPVLLVGLAGTAVSMTFFGLSRTFWTLVMSRCLCGLLNGNVAVMKSMIGELTDSTNRPEGMVLIPVVWAIGGTIAPMIGGLLSKPHERFPSIFGSEFWKAYPYFLPSLASTIYSSFSFLIVFAFLKETLQKHRKVPSLASSSDSTVHTETDKPLPLRELLTYPVIVSGSNYVSLAFMEIFTFALLTLFMATPVQYGGLSCSPAIIGYVFGTLGAYIGLFQMFFFAKSVRRFGERKLFLAGISTFLGFSLLLPLISAIARRNGVTWVVWSLLVFMLALFAITEMCFGCIFIYITASSPGKNSLGATNGIAQTTVSIARAIGPALSTSLFAVSLEKNLLGGYAVYVISFALSSLALLLALRLPEKMWDEN